MASVDRIACWACIRANPVPVMRLVEVVRAIGTSEQAMRLALELIRRAGKRRSSAKIFPASSSIASSP